MTLGQIGVRQRTVVWNKQESRRKYWATRSSVRSLARTAHFAHSLACGKVNYLCLKTTWFAPRAIRCVQKGSPHNHNAMVFQARIAVFTGFS